MPAFFIGNLSPEQTNSTAQEVFEVLMFDWGTNVLDSFPPVLNPSGTARDSPGLPFTPQAITLGPRSTIDRCWVSWNPEQKGTSESAVRTLSRDTPLMLSNAAGQTGRGVSSTDPNLPFLSLVEIAQGQGILYVTPHLEPRAITENNNPGIGFPQGFETTLLPTSYIKADGTTTANFYNPGVNIGILRPTCHLQFWAKASAAMSAPTKRAPWHNSFKFGPAGAPDVEDLLLGIPVYGRKSINLTMSSDSAGTIFRIAALRNVQRFVLSQEATIGLKGNITPLAANESVNFSFCDLGADYLMLYATTTGGVGTGPIATVAAYD